MRSKLCLNGEWDFMPLYGQPHVRKLPEKLVYETHKFLVPSSWRRTYIQPNGKRFGKIAEYAYTPYELYGYPEEWDDAEAGVLHRSFQLPEGMSSGRIVLRLDGIMQKAVIYLDHQEIGVWEDGYLPLRVDISSLVEQGREHHLHVVCGEFDKVPLADGAMKTTGLMGSWYGRISRGIWQDVYLECYPLAVVTDVSVRTSVREGRIEVQAVASVAGAPAGNLAAPLCMKLSIREKGDSQATPLLTAELEVAPLEAADGGGAGDASVFRLCENEHAEGEALYRANFQLDWSDARLWNPDSPFLYEAVLELFAGERVVDRRSDVFGFREFWCEGPQFMLNGIPLHLRGDSWHFQGGLQQTEAYIRNWYQMCRSVGVNSIRLHAEPYPADYLRIADEEGMLIIDETAIYGSGKTMLADHPIFIENCRKHVRRLVQRDKNHPSVILWSLQNEMRWVDGRDGYKLHMPSFMAAIRELDPTRAIIAEGDNRLLAKADTEVESRHYNIDGTISQWDRKVPLTFGEHGGWWYICPQNSSMYVGLGAYRGTDESTAGLAEKERLFVEYARRQGVSGISTFNFAHYFMKAMPEQTLAVLPAKSGQPGAGDEPGVTPAYIPAYSLTINNGLLPEGYPVYTPNPAFAIMAEAFKPATIIAAEYNRCFYDDTPVRRSFDVYNDTLSAEEVRVEFTVRQGARLLHEETVCFRQAPAEHKVIGVTWTPASMDAGEESMLTAVLYHGGQRKHELSKTYRIMSADLLHKPVKLSRPSAYYGGDEDYAAIRPLVPGGARVGLSMLATLSADHLLIVGSRMVDADGKLEALLKAFVQRGGQLLLLEQTQLSLGKLPLSRRPFMRAHGGDYNHLVLAGLDDRDLMFWREELREEGPLPIIQAAFEKPVAGDFTLLLECSAGDFGDGGDLWSPLVEYRSRGGGFLANQLELMANLRRVPQAALLLRNLITYAGRAAEGCIADPHRQEQRVGALVRPGGEAAAFLDKLRLSYTALDRVPPLAGSGALPGASVSGVSGSGNSTSNSTSSDGGSNSTSNSNSTSSGGNSSKSGSDDSDSNSSGSYRLLVAEAAMLEEPGAAEALRQIAAAGAQVLVLPAEERHQAQLAQLLDCPVSVTPHETYHLEADYAHAAVSGFSPVDLFGFDKVFLSPREVVNQTLAVNRLEVPGTDTLCTSVEGTAWKDYFVHGYNAEFSRLALVELNRKNRRPTGAFLIQRQIGAGSVLCSQLLTDPTSDKARRLYTRLLANLGAAFDDGLLHSEKGDGEWAVETVMALPCPPHVDYDAMKAYYIDPEFSLNNLGEGLYGWMQKKERRPTDGTIRIADAGVAPWFLSCFVQTPVEDGTDGEKLHGRLCVNTSAAYDIYLNGERVPEPEWEITLQQGLNRLIAIVRGSCDDLCVGLIFLNTDGTYMKGLSYRLTLDEVEPK